MSLATHVRDDRWTQLEASWVELMNSEGPIEPALAAVDAAAEAKQITRILPFVREHAEMLEAGGRPADAAHLLGRALLGGAPPGELAQRLVRSAEAAFSTESWWETYSRLADFHGATNDIRKAWRTLSQLMRLGPGSAFYHRSGWGVGEILAFEPGALEADVRFASGRRDRMPVQSLLDTAELLEDQDLRALLVRDPARLDEILKKEPLEPLLAAARRSGGRLNQTQLKNYLSQLGVDGSAFTSWWRRARKVAETNSWVEVTGSGAQTQVRLLDNAADPAESVRRQLALSKNLAAALTRARDLLADKKLDGPLRDAALSAVEELAALDAEELPSRLAAWVLLRVERGTTPEPLRLRLEAALAAPPPQDGETPPRLWRLFGLLPGLREQEACLHLLQELYGEEKWLDEAADQILHAPPGMHRALIERLMAGERHGILAQTFTSLLIRPMRNPSLLLSLAERFEAERIPGEFPRPLQRAHSYLMLASNLEEAVGSDPHRTRNQQRLVQLLTGGKPMLLRRLLDGAARSDLKRLMPLVGKGVGSTLDRAFTHVAVELVPDIFREGARPFWEEEQTIWTTRRGLERREAELRDLRENKIPANAEAIGKAASYGDLSENSEWEAAMEEQRNLTARAMEMEEEIRRAQIIENAAVPEGVAAPGTRVRYREVESGKEREVEVLGPWETDGQAVISYRSPIAQGLLGSRAGQTVTLKLPGGEVRAEVLAVSTLPL